MKYPEFLKRVEEYTDLKEDDAKKGMKAVLETFGVLLSRQHRKHLKKQLPCELQEYFDDKGEQEFVSLEDFYGRVAARTRLRFHDGMKLSHGVLRALHESAAAGELADILESLPEEFYEVFQQGPQHASSVDTHGLHSDTVKSRLR